MALRKEVDKVSNEIAEPTVVKVNKYSLVKRAFPCEPFYKVDKASKKIL